MFNQVLIHYILMHKNVQSTWFINFVQFQITCLRLLKNYSVTIFKIGLIFFTIYVGLVVPAHSHNPSQLVQFGIPYSKGHLYKFVPDRIRTFRRDVLKMKFFVI